MHAGRRRDRPRPRLGPGAPREAGASCPWVAKLELRDQNNLAAQVCECEGRYLHLSLELPPGLCGRELTAADMRRLGARVEEFHVLRLE